MEEGMGDRLWIRWHGWQGGEINKGWWGRGNDTNQHTTGWGDGGEGAWCLVEHQHPHCKILQVLWHDQPLTFTGVFVTFTFSAWINPLQKGCDKLNPTVVPPCTIHKHFYNYQVCSYNIICWFCLPSPGLGLSWAWAEPEPSTRAQLTVLLSLSLVKPSLSQGFWAKLGPAHH